MKAINRGDNTYDIFDDTMQVFEKLPAQPDAGVECLVISRKASRDIHYNV